MKTLFNRMGQIVQYAIPISTTNLLGIATLFFVTMMLSRLGPVELAALAIANACNITLNAFLNSCMYSTSILIGQAHASNNKQEVSRLLWNSLWFAIGLGLFGTLILWYMSSFLFWIGEPANLVEKTVNYFHFAALSMVPFLLGSTLGQLYNGLGKAFISTVVVGIRLPFSLFFCYELINGHYHLGLTGASLGMLIAQVLTLMVVFVYLRFSSIWEYFQIKIKRWDLAKIKQIFSLGILIGLQFLGELVAISAATFLLGYFGDIALASSQVVSQYAIPLVMIILGISQAMAIRVSEAVGRGEQHSIDALTQAGSWLVTLTLLVCTGIYLLIPDTLLSVFMNIHDPKNAQLVYLTHWFLIIMLPTMLFDGLKNVLTGTLRGLKNMKAPMLISTIGLWFIGLPLCYFIGIYFKQGPIGLRFGFALGYAASLFLLWVYYRKYKKTIVV